MTKRLYFVRRHLLRALAFAAAVPLAAPEAIAAGVSVIPEAAFSGERGMRILMNNADPGYVEDGTPLALQRYRARFWINLDGLTVGSGETFDVLQGLNAADEIQFRVRVREVTGAKRLNLEVLLDNATTVVLDPAGEPVVPGGWSSIEIDWRAATAPGQNDGHFHLVLNGNVIPAVDGVDTDQRLVDKVRLGYVERIASGSISGSFDIDEFVSREDDAIGAAPTTSGIADIAVLTNAPPAVIDLFAAFADTEDGDGALVYTVTANSTPALFASTVLDGAAGTLTLTFAEAAGSSALTVRATDTNDLFVETSFTVTVDLAPPGKASNPTPADGAVDVALDQVLSWTAGEDADESAVHFGTADPPPFASNTAGTQFDPGALEPDTVYFWRIDSSNGVVTEGDVWTFTTEERIFGDVNDDGLVDAVDIQLVINSVLGVTANPAADLNDDGLTDAVDIQLVINTVLGIG